ncbi:MAG: nucleotidyltransferase family protein [Candidatus Marinimicrobia bacterium]|nr:nucleotidyltransferase family protein [Candidatus Neomarinimicrobiota bacterium]MCF7829536.1 nucleotidyltransferase family protein [Candidatus Neomarinimicrobiota bacterium]MCF7880066.1 nucleotidyltransferase family protein [Candidatus Neomarinimicrobiota bacterium]
MPNNIAGIILAAGKSSRFGAPKVLQSFLGTPFVTCISSALQSAGIRDIWLVLGHEFDQLSPKIPSKNSFEIIENPDYEQGQFSSLQTGIRSLPADVAGSVMCLVDHPHINAGTYRTVVTAARQDSKSIVIPTYEDRGGHPVHIPEILFEDIVEADPAKVTLRDIFDCYRDKIIRVPVDEPGIRWDIDTPEDLHRIEAEYEGL